MAQALQPSLVELWYSGLGGGQLVGIATSLVKDGSSCGVQQLTRMGHAPLCRMAAGEGMPGIQG